MQRAVIINSSVNENLILDKQDEERRSVLFHGSTHIRDGNSDRLLEIFGQSFDNSVPISLVAVNSTD